MKLKNEKIGGTHNGARDSQAGRSLVETLMVVAIAAVIGSIAIPQMLSARRQIRSAALPREMAAQMRYARQQAMSQRQAFTFQYDDSTKTIKIYDHQNNNNVTSGCNMTGLQVLSAANYPNTACSNVVLSMPVATGGISASDWSYGVPTGINANANLDDGNTPTALTGTVVNVTFQSDGTVINTTGGYAKPTLFFYNAQNPGQTASAISVLGSSGRVKVWRYDTSASKYAE